MYAIRSYYVVVLSIDSPADEATLERIAKAVDARFIKAVQIQR